MSRLEDQARVIPAQVSYLTIYNPSFGTSDEALPEQILFYYSKKTRARRDRSPKKQTDEHNERDKEREQEQEQNKRLRQIGLAQGLVQFAKDFSQKTDVDTVETEKSRIVLHELEAGWWILASIDLTRLPLSRNSTDDHTKDKYEYSAREVSPAPLLRTQLSQAHQLFLLHHASSLHELYSRVGKDKLCDLLERYWNKFVRSWNVLLHGNPTANIYNAIKLSGSGELGIGVGEEEWGSGEREVLEGFVDRTQGLVDVVVGRYGAPPAVNETSDRGEEHDEETWLGSKVDAAAMDGVVFSGKGLVSAKSLRTISQWMETIYKFGNDAYGVGENPTARLRQQRKRQKTDTAALKDTAATQSKANQRSTRARSPESKSKIRVSASGKTTIPAPLVRTERSPAPSNASALPPDSVVNDKAPGGTEDTSSKDGAPVPSTETMMKYLTLGYGTAWTLNPKGFKTEKTAVPDIANTVPEQGSNNEIKPATPQIQRNPSSATTKTLQEVDPTPEAGDTEPLPYMQKIDRSKGRFLIGLVGDLDQTDLEVSPHSSDDEDSTDHTNVSTSRFSNGDEDNKRISLRTLNITLTKPRNQERDATVRRHGSYSSASTMRTIREVPSSTKTPSMATSASRSVRSRNSQESNASSRTAKSKASRESTVKNAAIPKTSAAASIDGSQPLSQNEKMRVAVYVHQPFIFVFLFELHTASLTMTPFYRSIHAQLGPLQGPLLRSTDPSHMARRVADAVGERPDKALIENPIHDLVYDPTHLTVRTTIPNIPDPASSASTLKQSSVSVSGAWYTLGIPLGTTSDPSYPSASTDSTDPNKQKTTSSQPPWSRTDLLSIHSQILSLHASTRISLATPSDLELEKLVKTNRGSWIQWLLIPPSRLERANHIISGSQATIQNKEAILVRRGVDEFATKTAESRRETGSGKWLLREQRRDVSGASAGSSNSSVTSAKGVSEGIGVDGRRWVEGLLSLT